MYMLNEIECEINRDRNETQVCACNFPPPIQERLVAGAHTETAAGNVAECGKQFWGLESTNTNKNVNDNLPFNQTAYGLTERLFVGDLRCICSWNMPIPEPQS